MRISRLLTTAAATLALGAALVGCAASEDAGKSADPVERPAGSTASESASPSKPDKSADDAVAPVPQGQVISYDDYEADPSAYAESDVVLYFHAPWCHECQATDASLEADGIPDGLTLVEIDYDSRTDLRQEYGVTIQHSFVLLDEDGAKQEVWTDTESGAEIADRAA